jgi:hypothetical protein
MRLRLRNSWLGQSSARSSASTGAISQTLSRACEPTSSCPATKQGLDTRRRRTRRSAGFASAHRVDRKLRVIGQLRGLSPSV